MALEQLATRTARAAPPPRAALLSRARPSAPLRRRGDSAVAAADATGDGGLSSRVSSPADALALPPRVALGALMALPDVLNDPAKAQAWLTSLASGARPLAEAEAALAAAADRGAAAEAELRALLPADVAAALPPLPPPRQPPPQEGRPVNPAVTFSPGPPRDMPTARFQGGLAANRLGSELERLQAEVAAVTAALAAARGGGALRAVAAREARAALAAHLKQLASGAGSSAEADAWAAQPEALAALEDALALAEELAQLTL